MDLLQLTYFCDAAESENFSRTAEKFYVPTSSVSQVIRRLEKDVGAELFDRKANRVSLNARGRILYKRARAALDSLEEARRLLADGEDELVGELRIFVGCNRAGVARAIESFRADYPGVSFALDHHHMADPSAYDLIINDAMGQAGYERRLLVREKMVFAVAASNPLAEHEQVDIAALADMRFIALHEDSSLSRLFHRVCESAGFTPNVVIRCDDPSYMRRYVEMGLGAAFFPVFSWTGLFSDGVARIEPREPIFRETYVFWRTDRRLPRCARLFTERLESAFDGERL